MAFPDVGDLAPDVELEDRDGKAVRLSSRWQAAPLVAVFLRHFG